MKRNAFTITELMVVIAIIALLVAILMPSLTSVQALAKASICRNNLDKLGDAFAIESGGRAMNTGIYHGRGAGEAVFPYPEALLWPGVPKDAVADKIIFRCPEDEGVKRDGDVKDMFALLEYVNPFGAFKMNTTGSKAFLYVAQTGVDPVYGAFTEFLLQDDNNNGQFEGMGFNTWWDTDGYVRVYHSGHVWVPSEIPAAERSRYPGAGGPGWPDRLNSCNDINRIYFRGEPAFGTNGQVSQNKGQAKPGFALKQWTSWPASYGISLSAWRYPYGTAEALVLVDYPELTVDLEAPLDVDKKLAKAARHLGKVNTLWADGSVRTTAPLSISPQINRQAWEPKGVQAKPH